MGLEENTKRLPILVSETLFEAPTFSFRFITHETAHRKTVNCFIPSRKKGRQ